MNLISKNNNRALFLNQLYVKGNGSNAALLDMWQIGNELGLSRDETENTVGFLVGEGLAAHRAIGGGIAITHAGVLRAEQATSKPEASTEHLPPVVNILHVQSMVGSQIQQGSNYSTQSQSVSQLDVEAIKGLIGKIKEGLVNVDLPAEVKAEADAEIQTVEAH
ncbi:hypothetical protein [Paraburkholderia unamae]|uniref:Uncharacterized protein n=1 Tax=Paraburkholderia unamae TaxID=219649 RepID=A0ACC6RWZ8_9BURK